MIVGSYPPRSGGNYPRSFGWGLGLCGTALEDVNGGEDDACGGQGGQGQERHRFGVRGHVPERPEGRVGGSRPARLR